jgi:hypothetical protein
MTTSAIEIQMMRPRGSAVTRATDIACRRRRERARLDDTESSRGAAHRPTHYLEASFPDPSRQCLRSLPDPAEDDVIVLDQRFAAKLPDRGRPELFLAAVPCADTDGPEVLRPSRS